jgi:hypothetical protein
LTLPLFHHYNDSNIRSRVVDELCRVAKKYVMISYFSPFSFTSIKRKLKFIFGGKKSQQHATSLAEVQRYFKRNHFVLIKDYAMLNFVNTLHLAVFRRAQVKDIVKSRKFDTGTALELIQFEH